MRKIPRYIEVWDFIIDFIKDVVNHCRREIKCRISANSVESIFIVFFYIHYFISTASNVFSFKIIYIGF